MKVLLDANQIYHLDPIGKKKNKANRIRDLGLYIQVHIYQIN